MANSPARSAIDVGSVIAGTYTVEALIGRGGMGAVFLASHNRLPGKKVAIKMLHADISTEEVLARFKREADIASRLDHPNIVKVDDYDVLPDGTPYIRLEYLQGESLAQRIKAGPMPVDQVLSIARQVGSALTAAHRAGIVHRDLKPQNVFLVPTEVDGQSVEIAKVLDFGISKIRGSQTVQTQDSALLGTPQYMAPEQATGQQSAVDERTDELALGAMVYEMLSGQAAYQGSSIPEVVFKVVYEQPTPLAQLVPGLAPPIVAAVERAMVKAQAERFPTVADFIEALTGRPLAATRTSAAVPQPDTGAITGSSRLKGTGQDAFAQTVGSGDHTGSAPPPATASQLEHGETVGATPAPTPVAAPKRRSTGLIAGIVLAVAAVAAGGIYVATRDTGHHARKVAAVEPAPTQPRPTPPPPPLHEVAPPIAEPTRPVDPPRPPDRPNRPPSAPAKPKPAVEPPEDPPGEVDQTAAQKLADAEKALRDKDTALAQRLANGVFNGEHAGRKQKAHAHAIGGVVACSNNDQEHAQIALRTLGEFPGMRKRVIDACRAAGIHLDDR